MIEPTLPPAVVTAAIAYLRRQLDLYEFEVAHGGQTPHDGDQLRAIVAACGPAPAPTLDDVQRAVDRMPGEDPAMPRCGTCDQVIAADPLTGTTDRRLRDAFDQLTRYGGEPAPGILDVVDLLTDLNDDWQHARARALLVDCVAAIDAKLVALLADTRTT